MHVLAIRRPGQRDTQKLVSRYGNRLVCVCCPYDADAGMRHRNANVSTSGNKAPDMET